MKMTKYLLLFGLFAFMSSCSPRLTPFTQDLQVENDWTESDLKEIQFYLSRDIRLYRSARNSDAKIEDGKIRMVDGRKVEEVIIQSGTPGVMVFSPKDNRIAVSFEEGSDKRYLMFGPSPKYGDRYVLLAKEWKKRKGEVTYEGKTYYTNAESAYAALMVDLKKNKRTKVRSKVAKGRKI